MNHDTAHEMAKGSDINADGAFDTGVNTANLWPLTLGGPGDISIAGKPRMRMNAPSIIPDIIIIPDTIPGKETGDDNDDEDDEKTMFSRSKVTGKGWGFDHVVRNQLLPNGTDQEQNILRDALSQVFRDEHPDRDYLVQHEVLLHGSNFDKVKNIVEAQDPKLWQSIEAKMRSDVKDTWDKAHATGYFHAEKIGGGDYDYRDHPTKDGKKHDPDHRLYSVKDFLEGKKDEKGRDVCVAVAVDRKVIDKAWDGTYEHRPQLRIQEMDEKYKDELAKLGKDSICFVAVDIGSKIKGHHVDIRVDSEKEAEDIPDKVTVEWLKPPAP
jgi:3D (Asp-Asp-Asp) domain-containing protein